MISRIRLDAFKAFDDLDLPLGRLTLLSGLNSSGKSSVLQALSLVRQSFDAGMLDYRDRNELLLNGALVELGTVGDIHCEYSQRTPQALGFTFYGEGETDIIGWCGRMNNAEADVLAMERTLSGDIRSFDGLFKGHFNYLRADRVSPELVYPRSHREVVRKRALGARGEYTVHYLTHFRDEAIKNRSVRADSVGPGLASQVSHWMGEISPGVRVEPDAVAGTDFVRVRFGFGSGSGLTGSAAYRPTHVGFGLTYTLPIVVALLGMAPGGMLLIENPEAHVHPRGQAALGTLMCRAAAGGVQVLVETHSDHVLNGVRIAAKRGVISRDDIRLHFFVRGKVGESAVESPVIEADGRLSRWPDGFFDQWDRDLDELLD